MDKAFEGNEIILKDRDNAFSLTEDRRHDLIVAALIKDYDQKRIKESFLPQQISNEFCQTELYYREIEKIDEVGFFGNNLICISRLEYLRVQYNEFIDTYHVNHVLMNGDLETILEEGEDFTFTNFGFYSSLPEVLSALYEFEKNIQEAGDSKVIVSRDDLGDCHYRAHAQSLGYAIDTKGKFHKVTEKGITEKGNFLLESLICAEEAKLAKEFNVNKHISSLFKVLIKGYIYSELKEIDNIEEIDRFSDGYAFVSLFEGLKNLSKKKENTDFTSKKSMKSLKSYFNAQKTASNLALEVLLHSFSGDREYLRLEFDALLTTTKDIDWEKIGSAQEFLVERIEKVKAQYHEKEKAFLEESLKLQEANKEREQTKTKPSQSVTSGRQAPNFSPWSK